MFCIVKEFCRVDYQNPFFCVLLFLFVIIVGLLLWQTKIFMFYQPRNKYVKPGFVTCLFFFFSFFLPKVTMKNAKNKVTWAWSLSWIMWVSGREGEKGPGSGVPSRFIAFPSMRLGTSQVPFRASSTRQSSLPSKCGAQTPWWVKAVPACWLEGAVQQEFNEAGWKRWSCIHYSPVLTGLKNMQSSTVFLHGPSRL